MQDMSTTSNNKGSSNYCPANLSFQLQFSLKMAQGTHKNNEVLDIFKMGGKGQTFIKGNYGHVFVAGWGLKGLVLVLTKL